MDIEAILLLVATKFPIASLIFILLGILLVAGQAIVMATPSKADDAAWEKIKAVPFLGMMLSALANFAPIQKK